nr:hsp70-binding protein 1-like [Chlorocebus sabaeus]
MSDEGLQEAAACPWRCPRPPRVALQGAAAAAAAVALGWGLGHLPAPTQPPRLAADGHHRGPPEEPDPPPEPMSEERRQWLQEAMPLPSEASGRRWSR